ncbi:MAG: hypothetical protein PHR56_08155 [Dehalococcoidales bacterium]|nr:hypothetical protein [Dehalococcoidales bacterium]
MKTPDGRLRRTAIIILLAAITVGISLTGCARESEPGTLQGVVTIGPIQPVERPGSQPPVSPEVFKARKIMVYDSARKNLVTEVAIEQIGQGPTGSYQVQLRAGRYVVDINHLGIDSSNEVPANIEIKSGQRTELDISIDTGIR